MALGKVMELLLHQKNVSVSVRQVWVILDY